ncbi:hypothetical protein QOZ80_3BG0279050 [Eleusine coracana subsp. coracana]|nr:hypothetical protein QOZ80_3BG0279050 [Eleusine coracana subsp. coracana]
MAADDVAAPMNPVSSMANGTMSATDAGVSPFEPSVWGDFFARYTNPISKESQEQMRERAHQLQGEIRRMFNAGKAKSAAHMATLVDTIEHLGIDHCFREEIAAAMSRVRSEEVDFSRSNDDLHVVALRFRLLRQHGIWVSADVFDKFRDGNSGSFNSSLRNNPRGLLSMYNAAHMAIPGEKTLDDAIAFAKHHLEAVRDELRWPLAEQVSRALDIPLPRISRRVESMHYIAEYEEEEAHDATLLELARLDFELVRCLHLEELRELSLWWRELYNDVKLPYARDRMVEIFFWACGVIPEEENSRARMIFAKTFAYTSLIDDTYDVHATLEESRNFNEAMQRWDESAVSVVPEYLRTLYLRTLRGFQEFEDMLEPDEKYRMSYVIKAYKLLSEYYLQEATWANENHEPSFAEHVRVSTISSGLPMLVPVILTGLPSSRDPAAIREAFAWADGEPEMVLASGQVGRFLNDMASYTLEKNKKDVANAHECYMKEFGVTGPEAFAAIAGMTENAWRTINRGCMMEVHPAMLPAVQTAVVNLSRSMEIIYLGGRRDAYTFASNLKDLVTALFLRPITAA